MAQALASIIFTLCVLLAVAAIVTMPFAERLDVLRVGY
jgi:hypothetical protein